MKKGTTMRNGFKSVPGERAHRIARSTAYFFIALLLSSCVCGGGAPRVTMQYALEYQTPSFSGLQGAGAALRIERFSIAQAFKGHDIIYSPEPYREDAYNYARWVADPADLVGDHLLRDLRTSGLFTGVFSYCDPEEPRYAVQGSVQRIIERDRGNTSEAILSLHIILLDRGDTKYLNRILFQKNYEAVEPVKSRTAADFAEGASKAAARLSSEIIRDVYETVKGSLPDK